MILVTGGTGLTGSHILLELVKKGERPRALKRENSSVSWVKRIFEWYRPGDYEELFKKIEWVDGDINDLFLLRKALQGVKKVYHCAAVVSYLPRDKDVMLKINVEGTANIINTAISEGVEKFCHCSSISSLGLKEKGKVVDENSFWKTSPLNSNYAISKFGSEREVWRGSAEGLNVVIVNPSIILGPGDPTRSSGKIFDSVLKGLKFYSGGITGYVDVRDVANIMVKLTDSDIANERFILNSENLSYKEVFTRIANCFDVNPPKYCANKFLCELAWRLDWIKHSVTGIDPLLTRETARSANKQTFYSNQKVKNTIGYQFTNIDNAISNTCEFMKQYY